MVEVVKVAVFGFVVGCVFGVFRQPIPAPPTIAGAAGVIGVTLGFIAMTKLRGG